MEQKVTPESIYRPNWVATPAFVWLWEMDAEAATTMMTMIFRGTGQLAYALTGFSV